MISTSVQTIELKQGEKITLSGDVSDRSLSGKLRWPVLRDVVVQCRKRFYWPSYRVRQHRGIAVGHVTVIGGGVLLVDPWNAVLSNCTILNAGQRATEPNKTHALKCYSTFAGPIANDVKLIGCNFEASTAAPVSASNTAMLQVSACKIHGTGKRRPHQYEGPLVELIDCKAAQITAQFCHGRAKEGGGIIEIGGKGDCSAQIRGMLQSNCTGEFVKVGNVHPSSNIDWSETRAG